jgi:hypothetical protein
MRPPRVAPIAVAALLAARVAAAQDQPNAGLAWVRGDGAERCPDGADLAERVAAILGRDPFGAAPAQTVEGTVERHEGRWRARLYVRVAGEAQTASREFTDESSDCAAVTTTVALAVALSIDPAAATRPPPPPPASPRPRTRPRAPRPVPPRADATAMELRAVATLGLLPGVTPAVALAGEPLVRGRFRLQLSALYAPETRTRAFGTTFAFGASAFAAAGCLDLVAWSGGALGGCAGVAVGTVHSVVFDLRPVTPGDRAWVAVLASARLTVRLVRPLYAVVGLDAWALPLRARFRLEREQDVVFEQSAFALTGHVGVGLSFW